MKGNTLSVSWNGATEVAYWSLEGAHDTNAGGVEDLRSRNEDSAGHQDNYEAMDVMPKIGFETTFDLSHVSTEKSFTRFRVAALDSDHSVLRYSDPSAAEEAAESSYLMMTFKLSVIIGFLIGARFAFKHFRSQGHLRHWIAPITPAWMTWQAHSGRQNRRPAVYEWIQMKWKFVDSRPG